MIDHIVLDVETQNLLKNKKLSELKISCAVIYEVKEDKYLVYGDTKGELEDLKKRILKADRITTWGGLKFDLPAIWEVDTIISLESSICTRFLLRSDDLRSRVYTSQQLNPDEYDPNRHGEWSLDNVSRATLGVDGKSGSGLAAPGLYKSKQWGRLVDYCLHDVKLTRDLCIHADKTGYLLGKNGLYARVGKNWEIEP